MDLCLELRYLGGERRDGGEEGESALELIYLLQIQMETDIDVSMFRIKIPRRRALGRRRGRRERARTHLFITDIDGYRYRWIDVYI